MPEISFEILVVDDEEAVRDLLVWMLEEAGHVVFTARHGGEALAFLRDHGKVDLVLSDVNMPQMDGIELARSVKAGFPGLPILLISGRPPPPEARPFLPKPFRWETLTRTIQALAGPPDPAPHLA